MATIFDNEKVLGEEGVPEEDRAAFRFNYESFRVGITSDECIQRYNSLASKYEDEVNPIRYTVPRLLAQVVDKYLKDRKGVDILDIAAGTGYVGDELKKCGFNNIDALDPSSAMLDLAEKKQIYRRLICDGISDKPNTVDDDAYDVVVSCGAMGEGHISCSGLLEMVRIVKPGGLVFNIVREEYLDLVPEFKDRLEPFMMEMETLNIWKREKRIILPKCSFGKDCVLYVCRIETAGCPTFESNIVKF